MTLTLRYAAKSDRGLIRGGNQDSVYAGPRLLAVADGMGGMAAGDVASNIVIATLAHLDEDVPGSAPVDALRHAVEAANQQIRDAVEVNPAMEGMGTTLTAMLHSGSKFGLVHIGDSRCYLLRDGQFAQITRDDTYVQLLVDEGRITADEANTHPQRSLLMRALDGRDVDPDYSVRPAVPGDRYLICSDGLSGVVSDDTIASTMREYADPNQCAERLVQLALRGGGPDNITVIIADVTDEDIVESAPVVGGAAANDRGMATLADSSMPSARASALSAPRDSAPPEEAAPAARADDADRPRRHPLRTALLLLLLLGLLGGGLWYGWYYTQTRYYVGVTDDGTVAVFRGIPGQIAGVDLSEVDYLSDRSIDELTTFAQEQVKEGIPAESEGAALAQLNELLAPGSRNLLPLCPTPTPAASSASPSPSPSPSSTRATTTRPASTASATPTSQATEPGVVLPSGPPDCRLDR
jgi:protein phosphatase